MTRKDYMRIAEAIATVQRLRTADNTTLAMVRIELAVTFRRADPNFDSDRFMRASGAPEDER